MALQNQAIQTDRPREEYRKFYGLTFKDILKLTTSLILPLALGIFTVMNSNNQQKEIVRQQERDGKLRELEMETEKNRSELQLENQ